MALQECGPSVALSGDDSVLFLSVRDGRTFVLRASGAEERQEWIQAIEAAAFNSTGRVEKPRGSIDLGRPALTPRANDGRASAIDDVRPRAVQRCRGGAVPC